MIKVEKINPATSRTKDRDYEIEWQPSDVSQHTMVWEVSEADARQLVAGLGALLKGPHAGKSIIEILWEELDTIVDRIKSDGEPEEPKERPDSVLEYRDALSDWKAWGEERGKAQGVAYAIAVLTNPYAPNIEEVRAESVRRRKERE